MGSRSVLEPFANTSKPPVPAEPQKGVDIESVGLMTLPRELRDRIYGYLLRVDRLAIMEYNETNPAKLDLSILRVNKFLHNEASETFLEENPWVCIEIEASLLERLLREKIGHKEGFPGSKLVLAASYAVTAAVAVAAMRLQIHPALDQGSDQIFLIVSLFAIPRLCRILAAYEESHKIDFAVLLNVGSARKVRGAWQERLLDWFQEARGVHGANIYETKWIGSHVELTTMMMSPITRLQEVLDRVFIYHDAALQKKKLGQLSQACYDYQDCYDFIRWFANSRFCMKLLQYKDDDGTKSKTLLRVLTLTTTSCALLCIQLGEFDRALSVVNCFKGEGRGSLKYIFKTEVWYHRGLRYLAIGAGNRAAYCFLQTLWRDPGHSGADEAIDKMELQLQTHTGLTEGTVLHNIQKVLLHFRHRKTGSAIMSKVEYDIHAKQWHLGGKDNYVSYYHCICSPSSCTVEGSLDRTLTFCSVNLD